VFREEFVLLAASWVRLPVVTERVAAE